MGSTIAIRHLARLLELEEAEVFRRLAPADVSHGALQVPCETAELIFGVALPLSASSQPVFLPGDRVCGRVLAILGCGLVLDLWGKERGLLETRHTASLCPLGVRVVVGDRIDVVIAPGRVFGYQRVVVAGLGPLDAMSSKRSKADDLDSAWRAHESEIAWHQRETKAAAWAAHSSRRHRDRRSKSSHSPASARDPDESPTATEGSMASPPPARARSALPLDAYLDPSIPSGMSRSRTSMIRSAQALIGHPQCFGTAYKPREAPRPHGCGEEACPYRAPCEALHASDSLDGARLREESIEVLSSALLLARTIEAQTGTAYQERVAALARTWQGDTPQVAMLGAFSSGKSTLINRLLGDELLPHARTPTTAVLTSITYGPDRVARLEYRDAIELRVLREGGRPPDADSVAALLAWLSHPSDYAVAAVEAVRSDGSARVVSPAEALASVERVQRPAPTSTPLRSEGLVLARRVAGSAAREAVPFHASDPVLLRVRFQPRRPATLRLDQSADRRRLAEALTSPTEAFCLRRIVCELPQPLLLGLRLLDTAGLCSPVGFHTEVTAELLSRPPDKVVVLLDVRRLENPTNLAALDALKRFVSEPEDYRRVTFGLTFWDLALRNYMEEDAPEPLDFGDENVRRATAETYGAERRRRVRQLVEQVTGVKSPVEPSTFLLGLGSSAPPDVLEQLGRFGRHLREACAGWVGVQMWAARWKTELATVRRLRALRDEAEAGLERNLARASAGDHDLEQEALDLNAQWRILEAAIRVQLRRLPEFVEAEREKLRLEIAGCTTKDGILEFANDRYMDLVLEALDGIEKATHDGQKRLAALTAHAQGLKPVALDRKLMGLSHASQRTARDHVSGVGYALGSVWDFFFGAVYEMTEKNRAAARAVLLGELGSTFTLVARSVEHWTAQVGQVLAGARRDHERRLRDLRLRAKGADRYEALLRQRRATLHALTREVGWVTENAQKLAVRVLRADERLRLGAEPNARVQAFFARGPVHLRPGRAGDEWVLFTFPGEELLAVNLQVGKVSVVWYPSRVRGVDIEFGDDATAVVPAPVPDSTQRFELHLANLRGRFVRKRAPRG